MCKLITSLSLSPPNSFFLYWFYKHKTCYLDNDANQGNCNTVDECLGWEIEFIPGATFFWLFWIPLVALSIFRCLKYPQIIRASLVAQRLKHLPPMWETQVRSLGREDPLEKEMVTHSSILAWRIPWAEKPGKLQSMGSQRLGHDWATSLRLFWIYFIQSMDSYSSSQDVLRAWFSSNFMANNWLATKNSY